MTSAVLSLSTFAEASATPTVDEVVGHISMQTGISRDTVETFAAISNPLNKHLFSREAAVNAFAHVNVKS